PELKTILTQVNEMELRVRLGELAQISPMLRKGVLSLLKPKKTVGSKASVRKAHSTEESVGFGEWKRLLYSTGIGSVNGTLEGKKIQFTLDDGSEVNLMSQAVAGELARQGKLTLRNDVKWKIEDINGGSSETQGVRTHCLVTIGEASVP
ncbi:hypothetical protein IWQ61_010769, partial [Dispira simplex]